MPNDRATAKGGIAMKKREWLKLLPNMLFYCVIWLLAGAAFYWWNQGSLEGWQPMWVPMLIGAIVFFVLYIPLYKTGGRQEKKKWPVGYSVALIVWEIIWLILILMLKYLGFRGLQYLLIWTFVGVVFIIVSFIAAIEK